MLKDLPFPYTSAAQHEHKLRTPLGPEWSTSTVRSLSPRFVVALLRFTGMATATGTRAEPPSFVRARRFSGTRRSRRCSSSQASPSGPSRARSEDRQPERRLSSVVGAAVGGLSLPYLARWEREVSEEERSRARPGRAAPTEKHTVVNIGSARAAGARKALWPRVAKRATRGSAPLALSAKSEQSCRRPSSRSRQPELTRLPEANELAPATCRRLVSSLQGRKKEVPHSLGPSRLLPECLGAAASAIVGSERVV